MSAHCSKDILEKHGVRSMPIRKGDEVKIMRGTYKNKTGKVTQVYRKKWIIFIEKITKEKQNGKTVGVPIKPSNCVITSLNLANQSRKNIVDRKNRNERAKKDGLD